jgi:hypothetical protein
MSSQNDKYGHPILEDATDPFYLNHSFNSNHLYSHYPKLQAERSASYTDAMLMVDLLMHKFECQYIPNDSDPNLLCFPNMFREPEQGTKLRNKTTGEVYTVTDTIKNPLTKRWEGIIKISSIAPPSYSYAEKLEFLDHNKRVRFTAEFAPSLGTETQTSEELIQDAGPMFPTIVYALIRKEPGSINGQPFGPRKQYKPMPREHKRSTKEPGRSLEINAQWFDLLVQFECFTTDNLSADLLAEWMEEFMRQYTWVLKYNGVQEILFWQRLRDGAVTKWRQDLISRTVQYYFRIEDLLPVVIKDLTNIDLHISLDEEIKMAGERWIAGQLTSGSLTVEEYRALFRGTSGEWLFGDLVLNDRNINLP